MLAFDARREEPENLHTVYGIEQIACDTYMRTVLDEVNPEALRPVYKGLFQRLEEEGVLKPYLFIGKYYIVSPDGTGYFLSKAINCLHCLKKHDMRFVLGAKAGDHKFLFKYVAQEKAAGRSTEFELREDVVTHRFHFVNQAPLNESHADLLVDFLEYWEITDNGEQHFTWVTDIPITQHNAYALLRAGRARWKTENETFNTLKNQGYHFEHNFGHGQQYLSVIFAHLMMLAFLVDQIQEAASLLFQAALAKVDSKIRLWEKMRAYFLSIHFDNMEMLYKAIVYGYRIEKIVIFDDTT